MAENQNDKGEKCSMTRKDLFYLLKGHFRDKSSKIYKSVENEMSRKLGRDFELTERNKIAVRTNLTKMYIKWQEVSRKEKKFLDRYKDWLDTIVVPAAGSVLESAASISCSGCPPVDFDESSERTKRRKTEDIRKGRSTEELAYATRKTLRAEGKSDAAKVLQDITFGSPSKPLRKMISLDDDEEDEEVQNSSMGSEVDDPDNQTQSNDSICENSHQKKKNQSYESALERIADAICQPQNELVLPPQPVKTEVELFLELLGLKLNQMSLTKRREAMQSFLNTSYDILKQEDVQEEFMIKTE